MMIPSLLIPSLPFRYSHLVENLYIGLLSLYCSYYNHLVLYFDQYYIFPSRKKIFFHVAVYIGWLIA